MPPVLSPPLPRPPVVPTPAMGLSTLCEVIRERIRSGVYDERLPDEHRMVHELGVSRTRLRAALEVLSAEGVVERKRGRGTFVQHGRLTHRPHAGGGLATSAARSDRLVTHELISAATWAMDPLSASTFGSRPGTPMHLIERTARVDGEPLSVASYVVRADLTPAMLSPELLEAGLDMRVWLDRSAIVDVHVLDLTIEACVADERAAGLLGCQVGAPLLRMNRHFFTRDGELLAFGSNTGRGDRFAYQASREYLSPESP